MSEGIFSWVRSATSPLDAIESCTLDMSNHIIIILIIGMVMTICVLLKIC